MSEPRPLQNIASSALVWAIVQACTPTPPAEHAETERNAHSFAAEHHEELEREISGAGGPHMRTLVTLAKCPNIIDAARALTAQKASIYPAPDAEVAADRIVGVLANDAALGCRAAGVEVVEGDPAALQKRGEGRARKAADRANMKEQFGE